MKKVPKQGNTVRVDAQKLKQENIKQNVQEQINLKLDEIAQIDRMWNEIKKALVTVTKDNIKEERHTKQP